ncbi:hypothetical protein S101395_01032 [Bacillus sonorensis]|uniref:Transposase n=1 Tax=Bacillus sonorensis TaxID=119858 RepID=A0ABM6LE85_9BACI|nr:hypothetical protein S101395_01032 [Bacillus sonorensis]
MKFKEVYKNIQLPVYVFMSKLLKDMTMNTSINANMFEDIKGYRLCKIQHLF